jgi:hypothetical protein
MKPCQLALGSTVTVAAFTDSAALHRAATQMKAIAWNRLISTPPKKRIRDAEQESKNRENFCGTVSRRLRTAVPFVNKFVIIYERQ